MAGRRVEGVYRNGVRWVTCDNCGLRLLDPARRYCDAVCRRQAAKRRRIQRGR
jgi:hypothetical protein